MISTDKYPKIIIQQGLAASLDEAENIAKTLYQLAFTVVKTLLRER